VSCSDRRCQKTKAFHAIFQELPEVGPFRTTHQGFANSIERGRRKNRTVQEQSLSPLVSLHVDFRPAQKATEIYETI
jgi:hypothetical protein